jgi:hypothetical protein
MLISDQGLRHFKRFIKSSYPNDDIGHPGRPAKGAFDSKAAFRRALDAAGLSPAKPLRECVAEFQAFASRVLDSDEQRQFTHLLEALLSNASGGEHSEDEEVEAPEATRKQRAADDPPPFRGRPEVGRGPITDVGVRRAADMCLALDHSGRELAVARMKKPWRRAVRDELQRRANDRSIPSFNEFLRGC